MSGWRDIRSGVAGQRDALIESLGKPQRQQEQLVGRCAWEGPREAPPKLENEAPGVPNKFPKEAPEAPKLLSGGL